MVQFDKLRLSGFKSFVDPTELAIEPGMTGIVGPNGCGKSNLVEAMKWVMGETSAKQMRGSEMEDVIFSGAGTRPARNIAEVMLTLDNKTRTAPAMVNDADQLDIVRRIERGHGSAYSVNGREIRARDVQTLFADAATGSRSTALVSQGRIGALINAKPIDRAPSSMKPPASPASMPAATRPSFGCAPPSRTWPACRTCWWRSRSSTRG
jgi:chromosome segregation protein